MNPPLGDIAAAPAVEINTAEERFASGSCALIVPVDLGIDFLHPAGLIVGPGLVSVALRRVEREVVKAGRDAFVHPILVNKKTVVEAGSRPRGKRGGSMDVRAVVPVRNDVQR